MKDTKRPEKKQYLGHRDCGECFGTGWQYVTAWSDFYGRDDQRVRPCPCRTGPPPHYRTESDYPEARPRPIPTPQARKMPDTRPTDTLWSGEEEAPF